MLLQCAIEQVKVFVIDTLTATMQINCSTCIGRDFLARGEMQS